jgi:hypothetical protein
MLSLIGTERRRVQAGLAALLATALLAGCGGSGGDDAPTKAAFIKEADAICAKADKAQGENLKKAGDIGDLSEAELEQRFMDIGMPPLEDEAKEIAELTPPAGTEGEVEQFVKGIDTAIAKARANPQSMANEATGPFHGVDEQAKRFGFKDCSDSA